MHEEVVRERNGAWRTGSCESRKSDEQCAPWFLLPGTPRTCQREQATRWEEGNVCQDNPFQLELVCWRGLAEDLRYALRPERKDVRRQAAAYDARERKQLTVDTEAPSD